MVMLSARQDIPGDTELVSRARDRDPHAIRLLIQRYNQRLFRIARSIVRNDSEAEDAVQQAYCSAFSNIETFRGQSQFGTWLARIVMNEALGRRRRQRPTVELTVMEERPDLAAQIIPFRNTALIDPETSMAQKEIRALLERSIDELPENFRMVLVARLIEGMSVEETAELFSILPETVKTRLHRARRLLKHELEKHIGPVLGDAFPFAGQRCERLTATVLDRLGLR
ncbi:MAG TPA: RNA polymerase sigma factor [Rhodopila sp.]|nr:RNA polymerase sigma factor [Rhodopila sp.]